MRFFVLTALRGSHYLICDIDLCVVVRQSGVMTRWPATVYPPPSLCGRLAPASVRGRDGEATDGETAQESATENREEVTDVHGHDSQHAVNGVSQMQFEIVEAGRDKLTVDIQHQQARYQSPHARDQQMPSMVVPVW